MILGRDRVGNSGEALCHNIIFLCLDRVWLNGKIFYRDRVCLGRERVGQAKSFLSQQNICMSR